MSKKQNDNMALWDRVYKTDPAHTKGFKKGGGFAGTAIKPYWLMKRATEEFGPCGIGWGWEELENKIVEGVWCSKVKLWYKPPPSPQAEALSARATIATAKELGVSPYTVGATALGNGVGMIEQWGQTVMVTHRAEKDEKGKPTGKLLPFVDEEAPKKAVTDAVTKCLSYLGFAGDVHMGLFDDSKYVEESRAEFRQREAEEARKEEVAELSEEINAIMESVRDAGSYDAAREQVAPLFLRLKALDAKLAGQFGQTMAALKKSYAAESPKGEEGEAA